MLALLEDLGIDMDLEHRRKTIFLYNPVVWRVRINLQSLIFCIPTPS